MTNVDVNKPALIFANFRLKDSDGSVKRLKRTAMSDICSLSICFFQRMETFHSFFEMRKRLESETKFFFLSSLFVLSRGKQRNIFSSLSTLI